MTRSVAAPLPPGRRGRPTSTEANAISQAILSAAHAVFLEEGYSAASMEAIVARAGVSKGTIYARYPNKHELFRAVVEARMAAWSEESARADEQLSPDPRKRLEHHALIALTAMLQPELQAFTRLIAAESQRFPDLVEIFATGFDYAVTLIEAEMVRFADAAGLRPRAARNAAIALVDGLWGAASGNRSGRHLEDPETLRTLACERVAMILDGVKGWCGDPIK
jgi:AcrR family transcriptional regulator